MEYADHVDAVEREAAALATAFASGPVDSRVPTCPEWSVGDLADHVAEFTGFWTHVLCEATGRPKTPFEPRPSAAGADLGGWYEQLGSALVSELRATEPSQRVWTWVADRQNAEFVARRCAHELSIHRYDGQSARGHPEPVDGAVAADGIEEIFVMIEAWRARDADAAERGYGRGHGETLHLHATDRPAEWLITLDPDALRVRHEHAKGDLALRGAVSDLELTLYDRPPIGPIERFGDAAVMDAWYRAFHFG